MSAVREYKVVLFGEGGVGKTSFLQRLIKDTFTPTYTPTIGVSVLPVRMDDVQFNIWDCAGQERLSGNYEGYLFGADAVIIMTSDSKLSYMHVPHHEQLVRSALGRDVPIIYVRNKCEIKMSPRAQYLDNDPKFIHISSKNNIRMNEPLRAILQAL